MSGFWWKALFVLCSFLVNMLSVEGSQVIRVKKTHYDAFMEAGAYAYKAKFEALHFIVVIIFFLSTLVSLVSLGITWAITISVYLSVRFSFIRF